MATTHSLYNLFEVPPTCTDDELRQAYHRALLEHHPDRNPHQVESATAKTQQLTLAYAELKNCRATQSAIPHEMDSGHSIKTTVDGIEFTIPFSFGGGVNLEDVGKRKTAFRDEWENFRRNPSDPLCALRLVHAAFRAEQQESVKNLLLNPILIDLASLLLSLAKKDDACEILVRWAEVLHENQRAKEAIQILEDGFATDQASPSIAEELRRLHYVWAQYVDPTTGMKATPNVRIEHLGRILELGFKHDYIYKMLAEAYHDLGDDEQARAYLTHAYELNPELSGAVRISRALGFTQRPQSPLSKGKSQNKYKYSRPEQIPPLAQIHEWAQNENWDTIIEFANPNDYSPRVLSKARETLRQIASSLGKCGESKSIEPLTNLLNFSYYWDVSEAAMTSLSKIGDERTLDLLENFRAGNSRGQVHLDACISYLRARVNNRLSATTEVSPQQVLAQAKRAFVTEDYGQARLLLENLLVKTEPSHAPDFHATILLARSCAKMNDTRTAIELIKPIFTKLPEKARHEISEDIVSWLWDYLVFQEYTPINDEDYRLALEIHLELTLTAETPDAVLTNLRKLTRWLELLGARDTVKWIRQLIRTEAPGTRYVDRNDREQYVRNFDMSQHMRSYIAALDKRIKADATAKLKQILKSLYSLESAKFLLDDR